MGIDNRQKTPARRGLTTSWITGATSYIDRHGQILDKFR